MYHTIIAHFIAAIIILSVIFVVPYTVDNYLADNEIFSDEDGATGTYQWRYADSSSLMPAITRTDKITLAFCAQDYADAHSKSMKLNSSYSCTDYNSMKNLANEIMSIESHALSDLADTLQKRTSSMSDIDRSAYVLSFVQSIPYVSDYESTGKDDYWKSPCETLYGGGDCEDLSMLYAKLMQKIGYGAVLVYLYDSETRIAHMCTAVDVPGADGTYVEFGGVNYYCCETTAEGYTTRLALYNPVGNFSFGSYDCRIVIDTSPDSDH